MPASMTRKRLFFFAKLILSIGIVATLYWKVIARQGAGELWRHIANVSFGWIAFGFAMQLVAVACSILRWQRLLVGQGIHAPLRHLVGSFMIGRFFGEFAPGGWTGLNGYRIYDIAHHTGKIARATASIGIEMVLGWISFGAVVVGGSFFGVRFIGWTGVLLVDAFFLSLIAVALMLVSRPKLFRLLAHNLSPSIGNKLRTTVDAVCAYEGKTWLVTQAALLGIGTHFFRAFIYVAAARALKAELSVGEIFFGSSLQVFATLMPASVNGIGLREATAVALYTRGGVPTSIAVLIPTLGFLIEMALSSVGGIVFLARRVGYSVAIQVDHPEREELVEAGLPSIPPGRWPSRVRGLTLGFGAGLLAGTILGSVEGVVILLGSAAAPDYGVLSYGALVYAIVFAALGALLGFSSAAAGRLMRREAEPEPATFGRGAAGLLALAALGIGAFRVRRDVFFEQLAWKSPIGLLVLLGCALAALLLYVLVSLALRRFSARPAGRWLLTAWGPPLVLVALLAGFLSWGALDRPAAGGGGSHHVAEPGLARKPAQPNAGDLLLIVVDTLRADHLPSYGYAAGKTPNLDRFAADAVRFDAAFANASWTRPSFASILSGRFAASHRTMAKSDALPDEIVSLPEALRDGGYRTLGVVTNYNIAPFFNFHQGFDVYRYLEPNFVLGANDTAAKLLLVQFLRQQIETVRAKGGRVEVGSAYQDASAVNRALLELLPADSAPALRGGVGDSAPALRGGVGPSAPLFIFAAYMDPHDPYYPHPYDGTAYARAAHPKPDPSEAPALKKLYDGEITFWDEHFGALIRELQQRGLYDAMTIVVTSDHGEEFQDHGGYWHGTTLYDEALRVPLFIKLPSQRMRGEVVRHFVQSIDLMPTLLQLADLPLPGGIQGHDVFSGHDSVFAEESHEGNVLRSLRLSRAGTTLKLITANLDNPRGLAPLELYRIDQDVLEQVNLAGDEPALVDLTRKALEGSAKSAAEGRASQRSVDLANDANAAARLRALGYAGGDKPE